MSTNLVLCVTNENTTVRLTRYRCKPVIFVNLLGSLLAEIATLELADVISILESNSFDIEESNDQSFTIDSMNTPTLINWAWLLDLKNKELKYWDVTAALSGLQETLSAPSLDPLDCLLWMNASEQVEMKSALNEGLEVIQKMGVSVVNYQSTSVTR
jgi:hypothetical protein